MPANTGANREGNEMTVEKRYGLQKITLADYPGEVAATIFTTGCNLRCPYCHNAELAAGVSPAAFLELDEIFNYLKKRMTVLGGVCITGGEALLDPNIEKIIDFIHELGLKVKLDTNGTLPNRLKKLKVDFIAMDIKTAINRYPELGFSDPSLLNNIQESITYIIESKIPHEFRTTVMPGLVDSLEIEAICDLIQGCQQYVLAQFNPTNTLSPEAGKVQPWSKEKMNNLLKLAKSKNIKTLLRGISG